MGGGNGALPLDRRRVAVIGAGAAGLVATRILREAGFHVTTFERLSTVGGVWFYQEDEGPMYTHLVTNLPKEVMQFSDTPFPASLPSFIHHTAVGEYLRQYATMHSLWPSIRLRTTVCAVKQNDHGWTVISQPPSDGVERKEEAFDAVVVCNGHYNVPYAAPLPGIEDFRGTVLHSLAYRRPAAFQDQRVLVVGVRSSGTDLVREIAAHAREVHAVDAGATETTRGGVQGNVWQHPAVRAIGSAGAVAFADGTTCDVDTILLATGYQYAFPFLDPDLVGPFAPRGHLPPLYKYVFHARHPTLSFLGLPSRLPLTFLLFELQARWVAAVLRGTGPLPSAEARAWSEAAAGYPASLNLGHRVWDYCRDIAAEGGFATAALDRRLAVLREVYDDVTGRKPTFPADADTFRQWDYHVDWDTPTWRASGPLPPDPPPP